ncbi:MAG: squalene/phytoene synthase family protein [Pelagimonas sp.]|jgi:phytoene/squalene synthetase|nr:squalene/phytoene synthase family protein [Pelagimonas sp.]
MSDPFADNPDLVACAEMVRKSDPDRFAAAMAAPVAARVVLFPIYAMNLEVARAPWASAEPIIVQMRLQYWRDLLEDIHARQVIRHHEVATPLALVLGGQDTAALQDMITAREGDMERAPFADEDALWTYLEQTAGALALSAAEALGSDVTSHRGAVLAWARAAGLVRYLQAVPQLEAQGKLPLPDGRPEALQALAATALKDLRAAGSLRRLRRNLGPGGAALLEFWQAKPLLQLVLRDPAAVSDGRLTLSGFARHLRLALS